MREKTLAIIEGMIANYNLFFEEKGRFAECALHAVIGKIGLAVELELITLDEADGFIDAIFDKYGGLNDFPNV